MKHTLVRSLLAAAALCTALTVPLSAHAIPYSALYVFGDSLSDNGNIPLASGYRPPAPYFNGRFSNGPVAVEYLALNLGIGQSNFHDYAVGGATTGLYNNVIPLPSPYAATGTLAQVQAYAGSAGVADPNALYMVWAGPNDFFSITNPALIPAAIVNAVTNLVIEVSTLHALGAQHILVPNMPNLGLLPAEQASSALATQLTVAFNQALAVNLPQYALQFDTFSALNDVVSHPGLYGYSNVTDACIHVPACVFAPLAVQNQYLFWDDVHPTTRTAQILAARLTALAIPEPGSLALWCAGLLAIGASRRLGLVRRR